MTIALKYHVSIGNGHCEIDEFYADTLEDIYGRFRETAPDRVERAQLYCNVRLRNSAGNYSLSHCKPLKLQAFYKVENV